MSEMDTGALESALGSAFSDAPVEAPKAAPAKAVRPAEADEVEPIEAEPVEAVEPSEDPADLLPTEPEAKPEAAEPTFEVEIDGKPEVITGGERVKELLARGLKAGRGFEENARVREVLQAHVQQAQMQQAFTQAASADIAQIQALDQQLEHYQKIDWQSEYDKDPFNALKIKEQRDQLREQRAAAVQTFTAKQQQFQAHFQQNAQRLLAAENEALLAKVPTWRNAEKAKAEQGEIAGALTAHYGFSPAEVGTLIDHRMLLVARDAAAYRKLLASKDQRVKQAREAQPIVKPGPTTQTNSRTEFQKTKGLLKAHGAKGNHKAQEQIATALFEKAFK